MKIQATKEWLKRHPECSRFEMGCRCVFKDFDSIGQGWCVGLDLGRSDLDVVSFCIAFPKEGKGEIEFRNLEVTVEEALQIGVCLNLTCAEFITLDPEFRKDRGRMRMRRMKALRGNGLKVESP